MAKSLIDTFIVRADNVLSAVTTGLGAHFHLVTSHFSMINVGLVACWIMAVVCLARLYAERSEASEKKHAQGFAVT